jgi:hypothetical protein
MLQVPCWVMEPVYDGSLLNACLGEGGGGEGRNESKVGQVKFDQTLAACCPGSSNRTHVRVLNRTPSREVSPICRVT